MNDPRIISSDDILHASPVTIRQGSFPTRIVLREKVGQYVTHIEVLEGDPNTKDETGTGVSLKHHSFIHGNYFDFNHGNVDFLCPKEEALDRAMKDFRERVERFMK